MEGLFDENCCGDKEKLQKDTQIADPENDAITIPCSTLLLIYSITHRRTNRIAIIESRFV